MQSEWVEYQGQKYLYINFSGFKSDLTPLKAELAAVETLWPPNCPSKSVLVLVDFRNTFLSPESVMLIKNDITKTDQQVRKTAVVGLTGVRKALFNVFTALSSAQVDGFDDIQTAQAWLMAKK